MDYREALLNEAFGRISSGGQASVELLFTADAVYDGVYADASIHGAHPIATMLGVIIPAALSPFRQWPIGLLLSADGCFAAVEYRSEGIARHDGANYRNLYMGAIRFRESRICTWREYYDAGRFAAAAGPEFGALVERHMPTGGFRPKSGDSPVFG